MAMDGFTKDMNIIQKLNDEPNDRDGLTAGELKAKFDEGGLAVKDYLNNTVKPFADGLEAGEAAHEANTGNPHSVTKAQVGLGNVPNVATNDQTPTYSEAGTLTTLTSGEKLSVAFGKLKKAVSSLISHLANTSNPHHVTYTQAGAAAASHSHAAGDINSGTLPVARGGTGQTTAAAAATALLSAMSSGTANMTDDTLVATTKVDGTATWYQRPATYLWGYIKGKADAVYAAVSHNHAASAITSGILSTAYGGTGNATGYVTAGRKSGSATGAQSTAEGTNTTASGRGAHAEGYNTVASGNYSHAEGHSTIAEGDYQHVFGFYNIGDITSAEIVGNGTGDNSRKNIRTLDRNGNEVLAGKLTLGAGPEDSMDAATKQYVDNTLPNASLFDLNPIVFPVHQENISVNTGTTNLRTANLRGNYMESFGRDLSGSTFRSLVLTTGRATAQSTTVSSFTLYKSDFKPVPIADATARKLIMTARRFRDVEGTTDTAPRIYVASYDANGKIWWYSMSTTSLKYYRGQYIVDPQVFINGNICIFVEFRRPTHTIQVTFDLNVVPTAAPVPVTGTTFSTFTNSGFTVQNDP